MHALVALTVANIKSFVRDRAALFWTLAFPLIFIFLFGLDLPGQRHANLTSAGSTRTARRPRPSSTTRSRRPRRQDGRRPTPTDATSQMKSRRGRRDRRRPARLRRRRSTAAATGRCPGHGEVYTDPSQTAALRASVYQVVAGVLGDRQPRRAAADWSSPSPSRVQTENLNAISYFVPSILGMSLMQLGIFAAIPLVGDREKLILKRLAATPLRRWQLVGSNILMRLLIALVQTVIIVGVGQRFRSASRSSAAAGRRRVRRPRRDGVPRLGYVIASFAKTEDAANGMTSVDPVPDDVPVGRLLPDRRHAALPAVVARLIPLTYLADALRQVMVGGVAFAPLGSAPGPARLARRLLRDRVAQVPVAVSRRRSPGAYQRS